MYCVSIGIQDYNRAFEVIKGFEMAEIRLDLCEFDRRQIKEIFSSHKNLIATYRQGNSTLNYRDSILKTAIANGAKWLDLDMTHNEDSYIEEMCDFCKGYNTKMILSIHNYKETPEIDEMQEHIHIAQNFGSDIVKLVFFSNSKEDNKKVLSLYKENDNIVAFNMGEIAKCTRIKALELGAPFTYVSLKKAKTAPGQMTIEEIKNIHNLKEEE